MADSKDSGDKQVKDTSTDNPKVSDNVTAQTAKGQEDLSKSTVNYYQARRDGLRDKDTLEHLPPKPEFFDSLTQAAAAVDKVEVTDAQTAGYKSDSKPQDSKDHIVRDKDGYVTEVSHNGFTKKYQYDDNGDVKEIDYPSGRKTVKDGDHWVATDPYGNKQDVQADVKITPNGNEVVKYPDGTVGTRRPDDSLDMKYPDGSTVSKDSKGRVTSVEHSQDGTGKDTITYDPQGNPTKVTNSDKSEWRKEGDGWNQYEGGKKTAHADELDVNQDGSIVLRDKDGKVRREERDGSTVEDRVGTYRDGQSRVQNIVYPNGTSTAVDYDDKGHVSSVKDRDGELTCKDNKWYRKDKDGNETETDIKEVSVTPAGDIVTKTEDGHSTEKRPDGTTVNVNPDRSESQTDRNGNIVNVKTAQGESVSIDYDKQGNVTRVHSNVDNSEWRRDKDGTYSRYDGDGKKVDHINGVIEVDDNGSMIAKNKDGSGFKQDLDGSYSERKSDGSAVTTKDGRVTEINYSDGTHRSLEYTPDKDNPQEQHLTKISRSDGNEWRKQDDGSWGMYDSDNKKVNQFKGDVEVDADGNLMLRRDGKVVFTQKPNGQTEGEP